MITDLKGVMNFDYSETQRLVAESAKQFAQQYLAPNVRDWDETQFSQKRCCTRQVSMALWES